MGHILGEANTMPEAHSSQSPQQSFALTQRELVGLALHRGARRPADTSVAAPHSQRERVRMALALGLGGTPKASRRSAGRGIYR
jgi:hypothetical protein